MNYLLSSIVHRIVAISVCSIALVTAGVGSAAQKGSAASGDAIFAGGPGDGGHLIIKRSPKLGKNITLRITIDDKPAGFVGWAQTYDKYITAGRHVVRAEPRSIRGAWSATLDVRPHQTYFYTAYYKNYHVVLSPGKGNP